VVVDLPRVLDMPVEVYLGRHLSGSLDCAVDANPPASQVVWTKNERPLNVASLPRIYVDRRGSLVFRVVRAVDEGRYACAAYSSLGAGPSSTTVRVYVRGAFSHVCPFALFNDCVSVHVSRRLL